MMTIKKVGHGWALIHVSGSPVDMVISTGLDLTETTAFVTQLCAAWNAALQDKE